MDYTYAGYDVNGASVTGVIEAMSPDAAKDALIKQGVVALSVEASGEEQSLSAKLSAALGNKITNKDVVLFTSQLAVLLEAGLSMRNALTTLSDNEAKPKMREVIGKLVSDLDAGREVSACFESQPEVFSAFYVAMIRVGEASGKIDAVMSRLVAYIEQDEANRSKVKSAMRYPMFIAASMMVALAIMTVYVIPQFATVFAGFKAELPAMTKVLIAASSFAQDYGLLVLLAIGGGIAWLRNWAANDGALEWSRFVLRVPIIGEIVRLSTLSQFCACFSISLRSGIPAVQALKSVNGMVTNKQLQLALNDVVASVTRGETIGASMRSTGVFTPLVLSMVSSGEAAGKLPDLLDKVVHHYETEVNERIKSMSSMVEPMMFAFMGALVTVLALGIFQPMWQMGSAAMGAK